ncbi:integrase [Chryseobacterium piperi]|uniref:phage integrase SAM-like domain-containing protein n=1 Tax=Chryseobacterium piperi TaxID=558152 RepID=UPI000689C25C|nr:phage integrase SAM-like domain-containing protein [Chryseobacterium piperi]ASW73918.1 integrase [Chryseobacterium piperi]
MTFQFFLTTNGGLKKINLKISDPSKNTHFIFRTPFSIDENDWDPKKERPKNIYIKKYKRLYEKMNNLKLELKQYIEKKNEIGKSINQRLLSAKAKQIYAEGKKEFFESTLLHFMQLYISTKENLICTSTYKRYKVFFNLLQRFEAHMMSRLRIDEINATFIKDFMIFGKEEQYSENTIYRTIHFVKTILNFAERKGIRTCVRELEIKREKQNKEIITLNEHELIQIKKTNVPVELQAAKDWLIISCYTGQRFSDFMHFSTDQLIQIDGRTCISFVQQKTQKQIILPLHPTVLNILRKNNSQFPSLMDMKDYNDCIKRIAKIAKLNERVNAKKRFGFRSKNVETEKWNVISSHIGRRSFATNFYGKIPTPLLMEATGHSTEQMFLRYINPVNMENVISLGKYFDKMYTDRNLSANIMQSSQSNKHFKIESIK